MILFLIAATLLLMLAVTLAHDLHRRAEADTLRLKAARRTVVVDFRRRMTAERLRDLDRLRVPASLR